jgi:magnesium transporter
VIECFKTSATGTHRIDDPEPGCWVNIVAPTIEERTWMQEDLGIMPEFVRAALDDEETSHVDFDDDTRQTLIIVDCPYVEDAKEAEDNTIVQYDTHPLSVLILPERDMMVTVSLKVNDSVTAFADGRVRAVNTNQRTRFLLRLILNITQRYQMYLRSINRQFNLNEKKLHDTMRNTELIKMLGFEKSLVYFSTSIKADQTTLTKINSGRVVKLYEDDRDLLDDVIIEMRQAEEMCTIYTGILNGTMDTFASVINNNMNATIKTLTIITVVLAVPTIFFSFWGMNVNGLPFIDSWIWPTVISVVTCVAVALFCWKSRLFK